MPSEEIFLVDAYAQIYRGFYAIPPLSNSKGIPSNAVFGLSKFLFRMMRDIKPGFGAFVFDKGAPAARLDLAPDYKANRAPMPDEMRTQIPYVRRLISALGWPLCELEGYEADDLLAGVTQNYQTDKVCIISPDKDLSQLVNNQVRILVPDTKGELKERGEKEILEKFEVLPCQIVSYLALTGDSSDNIPGIQGVGPKTASALIREYGDIENLINSADSIKNDKLREKIKNGVELLRKNIKLVSLYPALPDDSWKSRDKFKLSAPNFNELTAIFTELELKSLMNELSKLSVPELPVQTEIKTANTNPKAQELYTPDLF